MSDKDRLELAEVFGAVLDARLKILYTEIASGFVEILNCCMEDLAKIFEEESREVRNRMLAAHREQAKSQEWLDRVLK